VYHRIIKKNEGVLAYTSYGLSWKPHGWEEIALRGKIKKGGLFDEKD